MKHIYRVCKIISSKIPLLNNIKNFLPVRVRQLFYKSYILPYIDYCSSVVGGGDDKTRLRLNYQISKRAARVKLDSDFHTPQILWGPGWPSDLGS